MKDRFPVTDEQPEPSWIKKEEDLFCKTIKEASALSLDEVMDKYFPVTKPWNIDRTNKSKGRIIATHYIN